MVELKLSGIQNICNFCTLKMKLFCERYAEETALYNWMFYSTYLYKTWTALKFIWNKETS